MTKGKPRTTVLRIPAAETTIAAATTFAAAGPIATETASAAGLVLAASPACPRSARYATFTPRYATSTTAMTPMIPRGGDRPGELAEVTAEDGGAHRNRARLHDERLKPSVENRVRVPDAPGESLAQEDIEPAGTRPPNAEIGEDERAGDGGDPAEHPEPEDPRGARHRARDRRGGDEDADAH